MPATRNPDPIDVAVGARIRMRRQEVGLSQVVLAERIGVAFQQVQKYERGANRISASMLVRTARALDCAGSVFLDALDTDDHGRSRDSLNAELANLLAYPHAVELLRSFVRIRSRQSREGVLAVAHGLASDDAE